MPAVSLTKNRNSSPPENTTFDRRSQAGGGGLPDFGLQVWNFRKVAIASGEDQIVMQGAGGDPDVVFRDRSPFLPQNGLDNTVATCCREVVGSERTAVEQALDLCVIRQWRVRSCGSEEQLSNDR
jgi:hypothetical protein